MNLNLNPANHLMMAIDTGIGGTGLGLTIR